MAKAKAGESKAAETGKAPAAEKPKAAPPLAAAPPVRTARAPQPRDIGIDVPKPSKGCEDRHCPFHGTLPVRGQSFEGRVVSTRMQRTAIVEREYLRWIRKYERYEKRTKRFRAHTPPCLDLKAGDRVVLMECRPIAKTVSFVAIHNRGAAA